MKGTIPYGTSNLSGGGGGGGTLTGVLPGSGISVDNTIPATPKVSVCTTQVASIAALQALDYTKFCTGDRIWVLSLKAAFVVDKVSTGAADGNFYVISTDTLARLIRQLEPVPQWQQTATNGTGLFIDPVSGNDEAAGDVGTPIKSVREFCARMWGAEFVAASPKLTALTSSAVAADALFYGFSTTIDAPFLFVGTETIVASVVLSAATDLDPAVGPASITSTITDFLALGYESTTTRSLWAKRNNASGGNTTYAPLVKAHDSGGNFSVDTGPQFALNLSTYAVASTTTQPFAAADTVSLVSRPHWPGFVFSDQMSVSVNLMDLGPSSGRVTGATRIVLNAFAHLSTCNFYSPQATLTGYIGIATFNLQKSVSTTFQAWALGTRLSSAAMGATESQISLNRGLMTNSQLNANPAAGGNGNFQLLGPMWVQDINTFFVTLGAGSRFTVRNTLASPQIGIGVNVADAALAVTGSAFLGSSFIDRVNAFTAGSPWQIGASTYTDAAIVASGIFDASTLSAVVQ